MADYSRDAKGEEYVSPPQSGDPIDRTLPHGAEISAKGLILPYSLDPDQWKELGTKLSDIHGGMQWAIGDWWAYGDEKYGQRKAAAIAKKLPYEFGSLMNLGRVARRVTSSFRNEALSYSHHVAVAALPPEDQKKYLERSVKLEWSVSKLQGALAARRERAGLDDVRRKDSSLEEGAESLSLVGGHNSSFADLDHFECVSDLLKRARRVLSLVFNSASLEQADENTVDELVSAVSRAADHWTELARELKEYQEMRAGRGKSRSNRFLN
ncbi:hypothetical protein KMZ29_02620 [Bradyrhizobium sediminis]|uniref:DUF3102 domain-containing protein n=1 Tax=Bradyrhizobium sediminis TaxID=2840469 RepID=A0A975RMQ1_9BRAD|nr:hypothetical protein [Bradyrhizobium sediminis]QWG13650.1 hypothetical protein KMZ29_02620 [Bradyrhizobium sediminis]